MEQNKNELSSYNERIAEIDKQNSELSIRIMELEKEYENLRVQAGILSKKHDPSSYFSSIVFFGIMFVVSIIVLMKKK